MGSVHRSPACARRCGTLWVQMHGERRTLLPILRAARRGQRPNPKSPLA
jgi:hypothetical protein